MENIPKTRNSGAIRKWAIPLGTLGLALLMIRIFSFSFDEEKEDKAYEKAFRETYKVFAPELPDTFSFAGEIIPMHDYDVRERMDREMLVNTFWQSNTLLGLKLANRYFPVIEKILKEEGIPDDFKYLALIESNFRPLVSPKGAAGFWQFLEETAPEYGMEVNSEVDERYNLEKATRAACSYIRQARNKFGSWALAAASYNRGMQGIQNQIDLQSISNYFDLYLNDETSRYLFRMLALKEIHTQPEKYGFMVRKKDLYPPISTQHIAVDSSVNNLPAFALRFGIKYKTLKLLNPWLKNSSLHNKAGKTYFIAIPANIPPNRPFFISSDPDSI